MSRSHCQLITCSPTVGTGPGENQRRRGVVQALGILAVMIVTCGATCARRQPLTEFAPPPRFDDVPTLAEIIEQVNKSLQIQRLESNTLTISSPEIITNLRGTLRWERPHNFSLEAYPGTRLMGLAFAAGSNEEMFWLQTQMPSPPTLYYARHDEFESQPGPRRILPVSPLWFREALGVVEIDPALSHEGPITRPDGTLEIRSYIPSPRGAYRRHLVLDGRTGVLKQTLLYNHAGRLVATAQQSDHQYYSAVDWSLPHTVDVQLQPDSGPPLAFHVEVGFYLINEPMSNEAGAYQPPDSTGLVTVDLVQANAQLNGAVSLPRYTPHDSGPSAMSHYRIRR
ncbi:MAG: hypothetical protein KatS3mg111_1081 [Pirellulaceae bacterium]|nr:MAG: hypothetical protein KatS3mg111_1081 [Pirellulaceae bacterium]